MPNIMASPLMPCVLRQVELQHPSTQVSPHIVRPAVHRTPSLAIICSHEQCLRPGLLIMSAGVISVACPKLPPDLLDYVVSFCDLQTLLRARGIDDATSRRLAARIKTLRVSGGDLPRSLWSRCVPCRHRGTARRSHRGAARPLSDA